LVALLHTDGVEHLRFARDAQHVIVVHDRDLRALLEMLSTVSRPGERCPRLICECSKKLAPYLDAGRLPRGVALLLIPRETASAFVPAFMNRLGDNLSLENTISRAAQESPWKQRNSAVLILDASVNHAVRFQDMQDMADIEKALAAPGSALPLKQRGSRDTGIDSLGPGRWAYTALAETTSPASSPDRSVSEKPQERSVAVHVLRGVFWRNHSRLLAQGTTLLNGADYFLQVHIGKSLPGIRREMKTEGPQVGSVAETTTGGQLLEVVLQEKGFELRTERSQFLYLPSHGPSKPVLLGVRTPRAFGTAELRVSVYLRNQLVQALMVRAEVADLEHQLEAADRGVVKELEFSQTDGFTDLAQLPERALTIGVNREGAATHTLMVKGDKGAFPFSVPESTIDSGVRKYRRLLQQATSADGKNPRFPADKRPQPKDSDEFLSDLADLGSELYKGCFYDPDLIRSILDSVRDASDRIISVVRHDPRFAFPWQIFYDFRLPTRFYGRTPKVCLGTSASGAPCGHTYKDEVYCVRGFWGYRHQIEEMIGSNPTKRKTAVEFASANPAVGYLVSTTDEFTKGLIARLGTELKKQAVPISPAGQLVDNLGGASRPAVVMLLGHLEQTGTTGPQGPRIVLSRNQLSEPNVWLVSRQLSNRFDDSAWQQPNAIVMLLACESAATNAETLHDFVMAFHRAGAAAIVGVECKAFSGLLAKFGGDVTVALCNQAPLGQAMLDFRRKLLQQGDPLAFVFTAIGCADVKIRKK
jgi:hypothetical protein